MTGVITRGVIALVLVGWVVVWTGFLFTAGRLTVRERRVWSSVLFFAALTATGVAGSFLLLIHGVGFGWASAPVPVTVGVGGLTVINRV